VASSRSRFADRDGTSSAKYRRVVSPTFLRRLIVAAPLAVLIVAGGLAWQLLVGRYRPRPVCWDDMDRRNLRYGPFSGLLEVACVSELEEMKRDHPDIYACGARCVVAANSERDLDACPTKCPGFVDPLAPDDKKGARGP